MLTPAISASSTSLPDVIIENAFSTHVIGPPFLWSLPFAEAMTAGVTVFLVMTVGDWPNAGPVAAAARPAVLAATNFRREILSDMALTPYGSGLRTGSVIVDYELCCE